MAEIVIARSAMPRFLNKIKDAAAGPVAGPLFEAEMQLYQNDFTPVGTMVIGDFDVATYDGYAAQVIDPWTVPVINPNGFAVMYGPSLVWTPTGATTPNNIFGYYVTTDGGVLLYARRFTNPILLEGTTTGFVITPSFSFGSQF